MWNDGGLGIKRISQVKLKLHVYSQVEELRSHFGKARESGEYVQNRMNDGDVFLSSCHFDSHSTHYVFRDFGFITWEPWVNLVYVRLQLYGSHTFFDFTSTLSYCRWLHKSMRCHQQQLISLLFKFSISDRCFGSLHSAPYLGVLSCLKSVFSDMTCALCIGPRLHAR